MRPIDLARATNISTASIRFYEREGILPPSIRRPSGHRRYTDQHLDALKTARIMMTGYGWSNTRDILRLVHNGKIDSALALVDARHANIHQERQTVTSTIAVLSQLEITPEQPRFSTQNRPVQIGVAASRIGVSVPTIRFWEASGLIQSARDPSSNFRVFGPTELERLQIVSTLRRAAYGINDIRRVIDALRNNDPTAALKEARKREATLRETTRKSSEATASLWHYLQQFLFVHPVDKLELSADDEAT